MGGFFISFHTWSTFVTDFTQILYKNIKLLYFYLLMLIHYIHLMKSDIILLRFNKSGSW